MELDASVRTVSRAANRFSAVAVVFALVAAPVVPYVCGLVAFGDREYPDPSVQSAFLGGLVFALSTLVPLMFWRARLFAWRPARLRVDEEGLFIDDALAVRRDDIDAARIVRRPSFYLDHPTAEVVVRIEARRGATVVDVEVLSIELGQELLEQLGHDVGQRSVRVAAILIDGSGWVARRRLASLAIGADGLLLDRPRPAAALEERTRSRADDPRSSGRFVSWSEVDEVATRDDEVRIALRSREVIRLAPAHRLRIDWYDRDVDRDSMAPCLEAAFGAAARRERTAGERRVAAARALDPALPASGFRSASISLDDLEEVLADAAAATPVRRAAASLLALDGPSGKERARRVGRACVDPALPTILT